MSDRAANDRSMLITIREQGVGRLDPQVNPLADVFEAGVAQQRAGEQASLAGDLKTVADRENRAPAFCECDDVLHDRAESRDGARPQVVTVAEATRENHDVTLLEIVILVPEIDGLLAELLDDGLIGVVVAVGAWERHDAEFHLYAPSMLAIS